MPPSTNTGAGTPADSVNLSPSTSTSAENEDLNTGTGTPAKPEDYNFEYPEDTGSAETPVDEYVEINEGGANVGLNPGNKSLPQMAEGIIRGYVLPLFAAIAMLFVIYAGVLYVVSQGDPEKVGKAKKTLMWAILGIIVIVFSYAIVIYFSKIPYLNSYNS